MIYSDWDGLPNGLVEQVARERALEQSRALVGKILPEFAALDAAFAELAGNGVSVGSRLFNVHSPAFAGGAVGDDSHDDTAAWQAAIDTAAGSGGGTVEGKAGKVYSVGTLQHKSNVTIDLYGCKLHNSTAPIDAHTIEATGTTSGAAVLLTADVPIGTNTLTAASFPSLAAGDFVILRDSTWKYTVPANTGRNQEINRVDSVVGGTLTLKNRTLGSYALASAAEIIKLLPVYNARVFGGQISLTSTHGGGIYGKLCYFMKVEGVAVDGPSDDPGIAFEQSAFCRVQGCTVRDGFNLASGGFAYGAQLNESCHHCIIGPGNTFENIRENPITNNTRLSMFVGNICRSTYDTGVNTHGSGNEQILIADNIIEGCRGHGVGVGFAGSPAPDIDVMVVDNQITSVGGSGVSVVGVSAASRGAGAVVVGNRVKRLNVQNATTCAGVLVEWNDDVLVANNWVDAVGSVNAINGIWLNDVKYADVLNNRVMNVGNGWGITYQQVDTVAIVGNRIKNISSSNIRGLTSQVNVDILYNASDDTAVTLLGGERLRGNRWGTKFDEDRGAALNVADGGTIAHNCRIAPTTVRVTPSVAGTIPAVTALAAGTFTVALKTAAGASAAAQTVYWEADV